MQITRLFPKQNAKTFQRQPLNLVPSENFVELTFVVIVWDAKNLKYEKPFEVVRYMSLRQ